ncbi:MAG: diguanylate cyclase [Candidatus Delongbacteria bacterium]|nr:diguanylate cyclase [Candidatus Delongbacteria bacterium]
MKIAHVLTSLNDKIFQSVSRHFPGYNWKNSNYEYYIINAAILETIDAFVYRSTDLMKTISEKDFLGTIKQSKDIPIIRIMDNSLEHDSDFELLRFIDYTTPLEELEHVFSIIEASDAPIPIIRNIPRKTILIADRNKDYQELMNAIFSGNYQVEFETDGEKTVEKAMKIIPDVIIMDINLESIDGLTVCRFIREHARTRHIPIVILTEFAQHDYRQMAADIGVTDFYSKLDSPEKLVKQVDSILTPLIHPDKKILVVEDSNTLAYYIKNLLQHHNYDVELAGNGLDALQKTYSFLPHLMLVDIEIPIMDGFQFSRMIHSDPDFKSIPMIAMTGVWCNKVGKFYSSEIGFIDFLTKPFNERVLIRKIEKYIKPELRFSLKKKYVAPTELLIKLNSRLNRSLLELTLQKEIKNLNLHLKSFDEFINHLALLLNQFIILDSAYMVLNSGSITHVGLIYSSLNAKNTIIQKLKQEVETLHYDYYEVICTPESYFEFEFKAKAAVSKEFQMKFYDQNQKIIGTLTINGKLFEEDSDILQMIMDNLEVFVKNLVLEEKLKNLSLYDYLTTIYNRKYLDRVINREKARNKRYGNRFSIILFDIDHFKNVNDRYGHLNGDGVLKRITAKVQEHLRAEDVFCRYGGEEFIIVLSDVGKNEAYQVSEKIRKLVEELQWDFSPDPITVSCGVTEYQSRETQDAMIKRADEALYKAKAQGRNQSYLE